MVRYICIGIIISVCVLAIVSRKNYSKYKDGGGVLRMVAAFIYEHLPISFRQKIHRYIRKINIINREPLEKVVEKTSVDLIMRILILILILVSGIFLLTFLPEDDRNVYEVQRPEVGEGSEYINVRLEDENGGKSENYELEVKPREYTKEEFDQLCEQAHIYITSVIAGENESLEKVTKDLILPETDETGTLKIEWQSSDMDIVSNEGKLVYESMKESCDVTLYATVRDDNYREMYEFTATVTEADDIDSSEKAKLKMLEIEEGNRSKQEFVIPQEVEGVNISPVIETNEQLCFKLMLMGLFIIGVWVYFRINRLKDEAGKRDDSLEEAYFGFINQLYIYLGAGFTMQGAMREAVRLESSPYLKKEVEFTLNQIATGVSEKQAYSDLGKNLGGQAYMRLFSIINQNLTYGNSNLLRLLSNEVKTSFYIKKEHMKKKGEQASEKLLLPTSILMILVIVIVIYPAYCGM